MKNKKLKGGFNIFLAVIMIISVLSPAFGAYAANVALPDTTRDVVFTIHKYDVPKENTDVLTAGDGTLLSTAPDYNPLAGVIFTMYKVADNATDTSMDVSSLTGIPLTATDSLGVTTTTILAADQGRYLVVETYSPDKVTTATPSFFVDLPMTNPDLSTWNYDVHVYPKNYTVLGAVVLTKTAEGLALPTGKTATFKLQKKNSEGVYVDVTGYTALVTNADGKIAVNDLVVGDYQFVETVAPVGYGLNTTPITFTIADNGTATLVVGGDTVIDGTVVTRTFNNSSTPTITKAVSVSGTYGTEAGANIGDTVTWKLTPTVPSDIATYSKYIVTDIIDSKLTFSGLDKVVVKAGGTALEKDVDYTVAYDAGVLTVTFINGSFVGGQTALAGVTSLTIEFETKINSNAVMGQNIPNQADLTYNNGFEATDTTTPSNEPNVHTGGIKFIKVDAAQTTAGLGGAEFALYTSEADAKAGTGAIATATSLADGTFEFTGLAYGDLDVANSTATRTYYMVETKAPTGYELQKDVKTVIISATSYSTTTTTPIQIKNTAETTLPKTGGMGTALFTVIGLAFIGCASVMFMMYKRSSKKQSSK